ncbi:phage tail protein [Paenibacillus sp. YN15]|uniref:phage tail protein n=1 Tax=Paenibacillus sp. YN15 TaxID=1742774 RepID=UPI000DCE1921|nr:phage tail protein [Paenibacillus sp. YN15]RAV03038.1 hypothetical protein DQG13_08240 [Paenibacillus sp. YN15]
MKYLELWKDGMRYVLVYAKDVVVVESLDDPQFYTRFTYLKLNDDIRYDLITEGGEIRFPNTVERGQRFIIRSVKEVREGPKVYKVVEAHHVAFGLARYFYDGYIDFAAAKTLAEMLTLLGADTPYSFAIQGDFSAQDIYEWGEKGKFELLSDLAKLYGAEIAYDNYEITLTTRKGANRGATVRYKRDLKGITRTSHDLERVTRLFGYGKNGLTIEGYAGHTTKYIDSEYYDPANPFEASVTFTEIEDKSKLLMEMQKHLAKYQLPNIAYDIDFVQLEKVDSAFEPQKIVEAGDTVTVYDSLLGYAFDARVRVFERYPFAPKSGRVVLANFREFKVADYIFQATVGSKKALVYTSKNAVLKGITYDDSLTLVDGLGMRVSNPAGTELVRLGQYEPAKYGLALFNLAGAKTIWQDAATGNAYFSGNITASTISGGTITGGAISGGSISGTSISGGTITGGAISGGTITGTSISGGTVSGANIVGGTISVNTDIYVGRNIFMEASDNLNSKRLYFGPASTGVNIQGDVFTHSLYLNAGNRIYLNGTDVLSSIGSLQSDMMLVWSNINALWTAINSSRGV